MVQVVEKDNFLILVYDLDQELKLSATGKMKVLESVRNIQTPSGWVVSGTVGRWADEVPAKKKKKPERKIDISSLGL